MHVGFLFNHYAGHQVYHTAPVAFALSEKYPEVKVTILVADKGQMNVVKTISKHWPNHNCEIIEAKVPLYAKIIDKLISKIVFVRKKAVLAKNKHYFKDMDVLVIPEQNSLTLKDDPELGHIKLVFIRHGAGDRAVGFDAQQKLFDLQLASGQKVYDRLVNDCDVLPEKIVVTGYPKFDVLGVKKEKPKSLFNNDNPVVLYNPHYAIKETSFRLWGKEILDYFKEHTEYNLIFAPHVLMYLRKWRPVAMNLDAYKNCPNIHIDTGSERLFDMTYTRSADMYIGDVSSQVYEFFEEPRPCLFFNPHHFKWQNNKIYKYWLAGPVIDDIADFPAAMGSAFEDHKNHYAATQVKLFNDTFTLTDVPSSERSADAIMQTFFPKAL